MHQQRCKVRSNDWDGDEFGNSWQIYYILYQDTDDDDRMCFDLYDDDGRGNGTMIARGYNESAMRSLILQLGEFVEWQTTESTP